MMYYIHSIQILDRAIAGYVVGFLSLFSFSCTFIVDVTATKPVPCICILQVGIQETQSQVSLLGIITWHPACTIIICIQLDCACKLDCIHVSMRQHLVVSSDLCGYLCTWTHTYKLLGRAGSRKTVYQGQKILMYISAGRPKFQEEISSKLEGTPLSSTHSLYLSPIRNGGIVLATSQLTPTDMPLAAFSLFSTSTRQK